MTLYTGLQVRGQDKSAGPWVDRDRAGEGLRPAAVGPWVLRCPLLRVEGRPMSRWLVILAVVGALWPVGVGAAPRGPYQTVAPGKGADAVYEHLADPCMGVIHALLELGVNPLSADERVR